MVYRDQIQTYLVDLQPILATALSSFDILASFFMNSMDQDQRIKDMYNLVDHILLHRFL